MNIFDERYVKQMTKELMTIYPNEKEKDLENLIISKIKDRESDSSNFFKPKTNSRLDVNIIDYEGKKIDYIDFKKVFTRLIESNSIITGNGAAYHRHADGIKVLNSIMVELLLDTRKKFKKLKFKYINSDKEKSVFYDTLQKIYKILCNSYYGASIEKNSIFYDKYMGSSITLTGRIVITTAINAFESLFNNFFFKNENDFLFYIQRIKEEKYQYIDTINLNISKEQLFDYIISKFEDYQVDKDLIKDTIDKLDQNLINKIYYKNNLLKFLDNDIPHEILKKIAGMEDFLDPNESYEDVDPEKCPERYNRLKYIVDNCSELWKYVSEWVAYKHMYFYRYEFAEKHNKKTVLVVDTDSNFLYLKPFSTYCRKMFKENYKGQYTDKMKISTINISTFLITQYINEIFFMMGDIDSLNIDEEKRDLINMKNEFLIKRIMMTKNKKSYADVVLMQEGKLLESAEPDIKGMALRKTSLNKHIRDYFSETLEKKVLNSENIEISKVYEDYVTIQNTIRDSLLSGSTDYLEPGKVNEIDSYKTPFQIQSLRGALIWNSFFKDEEINFPEKVNLLKLKDLTIEELKEKLPDEYFNKLINLYKESPEMERFGMKIISLPKSKKEIPSFLIDLIDCDKMINDLIKPVLIILESLGFKTLDVLTDQYPTNIIEI